MRAVTIVLSVIGGVALLGSGGAAAVTGAHSTRTGAEVASVDVSGVRMLDAEVGAAELTVEFFDGERAELRADAGSTDAWTLERSGGELRVHNLQRGLWWLGQDWRDGDWFGSGWGEDEARVTLLLPRSLSGTDAELELRAGSLHVDGSFGEVEADVSAGAFSLTGEATALRFSLSAGQADIAVDGVERASYDVTAGRVVSRHTGGAPDEVRIEVAAGDVDVTLPSGEYDVRRGDVSMGSLDSRLREDRASDHRVDVTVSAGTVTLRE